MPAFRRSRQDCRPPGAARAGDSPAAGPQVRPVRRGGCRPSLARTMVPDAVTSGSLPDCTDPQWKGPSRIVRLVYLPPTHWYRCVVAPDQVPVRRPIERGRRTARCYTAGARRPPPRASSRTRSAPLRTRLHRPSTRPIPAAASPSLASSHAARICPSACSTVSSASSPATSASTWAPPTRSSTCVIAGSSSRSRRSWRSTPRPSASWRSAPRRSGWSAGRPPRSSRSARSATGSSATST